MFRFTSNQLFSPSNICKMIKNVLLNKRKVFLFLLGQGSLSRTFTLTYKYITSFLIVRINGDAYSESRLTSKMELFVKIDNS